MHSTTSIVSKRPVSLEEGGDTYPHDSQCHLRHPKPPLNVPILPYTPNNCRSPLLMSHTRLNMQQFSQEGKCAPQSPPRSGDSTQCTTDQQGYIPSAVDSQNDGHARVQTR